MELLKDWNIDKLNNVDNVSKKVINVFKNVYKNMLVCEQGTTRGTIEEIFGLPYTSSGFCAELGCRCNGDWRYKYMTDYHLNGLALDQNGVVYAYFDRGLFDEDYLYLPIGVITFERDYSID